MKTGKSITKAAMTKAKSVLASWKFYDESGKMVKEIDYDKEKGVEKHLLQCYSFNT